MYVETQEQSKQWMYTRSLNKPNKFKQTFARRLMATVFWDGKGVLMVKSMQEGTTIMLEVYHETLKKPVGALRTKCVECSHTA
jgi:hypothetical protein